MNYVVDRFEGEIVVLNNMNTGENIEIDTKLLPKGVKEGDIIYKSKDKLEINNSLTQSRKTKIKNKMDRLFKK